MYITAKELTVLCASLLPKFGHLASAHTLGKKTNTKHKAVTPLRTQA